MKSLAINKRAKFDYDIKKVFDAGLLLSGAEVKSAKKGDVSLAGSYIKATLQGANLVNAHIGPYKYAKQEGYNPTQNRALLLKKSELVQLVEKTYGTITVPLELFIGSKGLVKLKIGVGSGRKKADKREYLKKRDQVKEIRKVTDK